MDITASSDGKVARFTLAGRVDEPGAEQLKAKINEVAKGALQEAIFDFRGVTFIGSAGIGKLLLFYKTMAAAGGVITLVNISADIRPMFTATKLDTIFNIT